jgi:outer membrane protein OmpA-like peptidoglycan-associated protein
MIVYLLLLLFGLPGRAVAQTDGDQDIYNIVPNPGFEQFSTSPIGWYYKGEHFTRVMKYWSAPTGASPDAFGPDVRVPYSWAEKGFGEQTPHSGEGMAGLTLYGCTGGKPHCREYIQVQMIEPLVPGQEYEVEIWVSHLPRSLMINNLGAFFSPQKISIKTDELLPLKPQVYASGILNAAPDRWIKVNGKFKATDASDHLIIGNFFPDEQTAIYTHREDCFRYAYYYIDDVSVKKVPPILPIPVDEDDLSRISLEEGKVVQLKNIYFEFDKWDLHPRSFVELRKLLKIMQDNPSMIIQINGHTDIKGSHNYNLYLSRKRAKAVATFLNEQGIARYRTLYKGYGSAKPIATNETDEGRQLNRRVEFVIVKK